MNLLKKCLSVVVALVLSLSLALPALGESSAEEPLPAAAAQSVESAALFTNLTPETPVTVESSADVPAFSLPEDAEVLRDEKTGAVYMITFPKAPAVISTPEKAASLALSLAPALGADETLTLSLHGLFGLCGTRIYAFSQMRDGDILPGRNLKLSVDEAGGLRAVYSSLGSPEETEESLGAAEDPLGEAFIASETPALPDFDAMIPGEYTVDVKDPVSGEQMSLTVPVMQSPIDGSWMLGDAQRKVVVGNFKTMVLDHQPDCLLTSSENAGWAEEDLFFYYRILQTWDEYASLGWKGADGLGTPILLLNNLSLLNGDSMMNAAYLAPNGPWQVFGYSTGMGFGRCLDVVAHEFTHCFTQASESYSLYKDDAGAINEAFSDIIGNLIEQRLAQTGDQTWLIGENMGSALRSMSDPHSLNQPLSVWDEFYGPSALRPNDINDRGGVHFNSSIPNAIAARLCLEEGMTVEEALRFWMAADLLSLGSTDFPQLAALLPRALDLAGCSSHQDALQRLMQEARLTEKDLPAVLPENQTVVSLTLPDTEALKDQYWVLLAVQVDVLGLLDFVEDFVDTYLKDEESAARFFSILENLGSSELMTKNGMSQETTELSNSINRLFPSHYTWVSKDGEPMSMVVARSVPTFFLLINIDPVTMEDRGSALLTANGWIDMSVPAPAGKDENASGEFEMSDELFGLLLSTALELIFPTAASQPRVVLPTEGLETLTVREAVPAE